MSTLLTPDSPSAVAAQTQVRRRRPKLSAFTAVAGTWLAVVIIACVLASVLAPYDSMDQDLTRILQGPSSAHWLGTDSLGRDLLSRLMFGGQSTLAAVVIALVTYLVVGSTLGLLAGYLSGWTDRGISGLNAIFIAMPHIIILFVVLSIYRGNLYLAMFVFGLLCAPVLALMVRSAAAAARNELFVDAARVSGLSPLRIIFRHILPRTIGLIVVQGTVFGANVIVLESALSFLGFGTQPPDPSWGNMVAEAAANISLNAWMLYPTGAIIALTALSVGLLGDSLRNRLTGGWTEPKLTLNSGALAPASVFPQVPAEVLLAVDDLSVGYRVGEDVKPVVRGVGFQVRRGETVGIVGESGSGKSTVASAILGVVGNSAVVTSGTAVYDGTNLLSLSSKELSAYRGSRIAYVAQEPMVALDPNFTTGKQLVEAIRSNTALTKDEAKARAIELLELVEIRDPQTCYRSYPHQLSGGMAQRVSIAFALSGEPELLVADEPTTALDVTVQAGILGLLIRLRETAGLSIVIITHDWGVVADVCDRVVVMYKGEVVEESTAELIYNDPQHPYTQALLASNPHGATALTDLPVITGTFETPSTKPESASFAQAER
ncbi:dipeptide/oligopeptide/nickel ABC transporter permease/ATP-binding protein [Rhodococcoides kyotonense]|uniref:Peptide/nickel transport system permease protein n=1 Tax=Rhodococcoides kyotonense TaxID=398843 RepID=A0A239MYR3_9NOCA|nr:dipeptide/oligopeptide/nickel ABC transporter permease/ATP-binding protein [Rhodococcus kyotonensis]SNT47846.1 peptide/nickel transport system permease protein [Rhodococcus kyotonensis]